MGIKRVTLRDVARLAGVSVSTVSRVCRNHPDVDENTKRAVRKVIDALNYRPSFLGRGLVSGRTQSIALFVSDITNPFYPELVSAVGDSAGSKGYSIFVCNTYDQRERTKQYAELVLSHGVSGVIHASVADDEDITRQLNNFSVPVIIVNRRPKHHAIADVVLLDNREASAIAVRYLVRLGHRRIALVTGNSKFSTAQERLDGFQQELERNDIGYEPSFVRHLKEPTRNEGYAIGKVILEAKLPPTAIMANDIVAYGILDAAQDQGFRVPQDLSIIGFGALDSPNLGPPKLTSVSAQIQEMGVAAVERLFERLSNPDLPPSVIVLKPYLVERETAVEAKVS